MANFTVKLVDHTSSSDNLKKRLQTAIQSLFTQVFQGTSDGATVSWGDSDPSDTLILHFVPDIDGSYIEAQWPGAAIRGDAGGHTRTRNHVTGSEFYKHMVISGKLSMVKDDAYGRLAFHESLHNRTGLGNTELHGQNGGGGLATSPPGKMLTDKNKEMMRQGLARSVPQLQ
jgi:hypothetical protein